MLKRKTILLMVSAIALFGLVALFEGNRSVTSSRSEEPTTPTDSPLQAAGESLFPFTEEDVERVEVQREAETLVFIKREDGTWEMQTPTSAPAEEGAIAFLLSQITSTSIHTLSTDISNLRDFGLQNPGATVVLSANNTTYQLTIGDDDFTGDQLYVRAEPPAEAADDPEQIKIHVVSGGMRNAVDRPTADWLMASETEANEGDADNNEAADAVEADAVENETDTEAQPE